MRPFLYLITVKALRKIPWSVLGVLCVTLGLAPYAPPHVWEKLIMLFSGNLERTIDWFDLLLHGTPWLLLLAKALVTERK